MLFSQSSFLFDRIIKAGIGRLFPASWSTINVCSCLAFALLSLFAPIAAHGETPPKSVLVIEEADANRGPFYTAMFGALRTRLYAAKRPLSLYIENLDLPFFEGPEYEEALKQFLVRKYHDRPIDVVIAIGEGALIRAIKWRPEVWSNTPIVFAETVDTAIEPQSLPA